MAAATAAPPAVAAALCWPAQAVPVCFGAGLQKHLDLDLPRCHQRPEDLPHHVLLLLLLYWGLQVGPLLQDLLLLCWHLADLPAAAGQDSRPNSTMPKNGTNNSISFY
jgi:hypothetical protein